ncbi:3-methyl-2-oxobutanoate dehydrogenase subunit VorB [Marinitoga lauensis]|uniref:3-methyl-2-oxobutanoate dehydrogenase subunit VorB n=1 Tax=Marinitoga lauensis TaxID=2201189 RepID=UPI00101257C4|nr:3-methyl-2-oxobutanoate dehydrogenase subunit VorB [Marinitoga lauensis]
MAEKVMVKGTEAIGEAAIRAGCRLYFGYPITPQSELTEYMSRRMPQVDGVFLQAESEVAAVNMLYGAASTGHRVMTSTSSPGYSLMQEGVSYIAGAELPVVFVNVVRGGPGLGDIQPAQSDYFQATKGGGHGDYRLVVYGPESLQEAVELTAKAFDVADKYRNPALILADGMLGQMMEPVEFPEFRDLSTLPDHSSWAMQGAKGREPHKITSFDINEYVLEQMNLRYQEKYKKIIENEQMWEEYKTDDADIIIVAYGTMGRIAKTIVNMAREKGVKAGLFRPITLWPYPYEALAKLADQAKLFFTVEMSMGQMVEDVKLAVNGKKTVEFYGRTGGVVPTPNEVLAKLMELI